MSTIRLLIAIAFFGLFIYLGFQDGASGPQADAKSYSTFQDMTVAEAGQYLANGDRHKAVVVFATWCPACRVHLPQFMDMDKFGHVERVAISIDKNAGKLDGYIRGLKSNDMTWIRVPYPCSGFPCKQMEQQFRAIGINYYGGIPYFAVLDPQGRPVKQDPHMQEMACMIGGRC